MKAAASPNQAKVRFPSCARAVLSLLLVAFMAGFFSVLLRPEEPEPIYRGRPLSYWLQGFAPGAPSIPILGGSHGVSYIEALAAVHVLGSNSIPVLLRFLSKPDTPLTDRYFALAARQKFIHLAHTSPLVLQHEAIMGFEALGLAASSAAPRLIEMYEQPPNHDSRLNIIEILADVLDQAPAPQAQAAVALMIRASSDRDAELRLSAIAALGQMRNEPAQVVPALTRLLENPDDDTRAEAASALACFGPTARPAFPVLLKLFENPKTNSPNLMHSVEHALNAIDPEAAVRARILVGQYQTNKMAKSIGF